jgi:hypothetical protein
MVGWSHYIRVTPDNPASNLTEFNYTIPVPLLPAGFLSIAKADLSDVRATLDDGVTEIPCYVHRGATGLIYFKHSPLAAGAGTIRLHAGNAAASAPAAGATYGQHACFNSTIRACYPDGLGNDLTSFANNLTAVASPGAADGTDALFSGAFSTALNGSTQYGHSSVSVPTAVPLTLFAVGRSTSATAYQCPISLGDTGASTDYFNIDWRGDVAGDPIRAITANDPTYGVATSTANPGYAVNTWAHVYAAFESDNITRRISKNAANRVTDTLSVAAPTSLDRIAVGVTTLATPAGFFAGRLCFLELHTAARSIDWDAYRTAMIMDPATFWAVGSVQSARASRGGVGVRFGFGF